MTLITKEKQKEKMVSDGDGDSNGDGELFVVPMAQITPPSSPPGNKRKIISSSSKITKRTRHDDDDDYDTTKTSLLLNRIHADVKLLLNKHKKTYTYYEIYKRLNYLEYFVKHGSLFDDSIDLIVLNLLDDGRLKIRDIQLFMDKVQHLCKMNIELRQQYKKEFLSQLKTLKEDVESYHSHHRVIDIDTTKKDIYPIVCMNLSSDKMLLNKIREEGGKEKDEGRKEQREDEEEYDGFDYLIEN